MKSELRQIRTPLTQRTAEVGSTEPYADTIVSIWHDINIALSPVIGQQSVTALYRRSLYLARNDYPWLSVVHENTLEPGDFSALQMALSRQNSTDAVAMNNVLLQTFHDRLTHLIGRSLTEQLLQCVWHAPSSHATQQDFIERRAARLCEANQQLVLATLRAETLARTVTSKLEEVSRSSQRDALTDTPNRTLMHDRLESAITLAQRHGTRFAVLFLDLDRFKQINDTLGHTVGDTVMQLVARRLKSAVRDSDTVSRYGGDEFLILLNGITQASEGALVAANLLATLAAPSGVGDHTFHLSASLGIAIYPEDGSDSATLIDRADSAMYRAKKRGGGRFELYSYLTGD